MLSSCYHHPPPHHHHNHHHHVIIMVFALMLAKRCNSNEFSNSQDITLRIDPLLVFGRLNFCPFFCVFELELESNLDLSQIQHFSSTNIDTGISISFSEISLRYCALKRRSLKRMLSSTLCAFPCRERENLKQLLLMSTMQLRLLWLNQFPSVETSQV